MGFDIGPERTFSWASTVLLCLVALTIFVVPAFPYQISNLLYAVFFTGIYVFAALTITKRRRFAIGSAVVLILLIWILHLAGMQWLKIYFRILQILCFFWLVIELIRQVSLAERVTTMVIVEAIISYLLLGFAFSLAVTVLMYFVPGAYTIAVSVDPEENIHELFREKIYYSFVTYSTTGYGDILPVHPIAKSLAILMGVSGQLFLATIIAMLVGKYASKSNSNKS
jgi:hypothetical protein